MIRKEETENKNHSQTRQREHDADRLLSRSDVINKYDVPLNVIKKYFPYPMQKRVRGRNGNYRTLQVWKESEIQKLLQRPDIVKAIAVSHESRDQQRMYEEISGQLLRYSPEYYIQRAKTLKRVFVLHVGPTNSGKTYNAIQALKQAGNGVYLGPLRLLALEMYDKLNGEGYPCSLLTGEESLPVEGAQIVSSTIELCNYSQHYKVAVIDEAQLISDPSRGATWLRAICMADADEVHICLAPEALEYMKSLIEQFGDPYAVEKRERLVPLQYSGSIPDYSFVQPHDAVICFSRKSVLATAALIERTGRKVSVIYGALPPEARRNEVNKYVAGETDSIVATDAIGMGISLPIRRIIFAETKKFDGKDFRDLTASEVNQIAGRAGRFGMYDLGEVLTLGDSDVIASKFGRSAPFVRAACVELPREMLESGYPLGMILKVWQMLPKTKEFVREDMSEAITLLKLIESREDEQNRNLIFNLITCPVDVKVPELVTYWHDCVRAILSHRKVPRPHFGIETLRDCELQFKAYDIHHQLLRRIDVPDHCDEERRIICERIAELMLESKDGYIRKCKYCGAELPPDARFDICEACFGRHGYVATYRRKKDTDK